MYAVLLIIHVSICMGMYRAIKKMTTCEPLRVEQTLMNHWKKKKMKSAEMQKADTQCRLF
ncbi:TPA: hypothetical protein I7768_03700 [Vibrio vulnificus]|nr:hypothetical protein [Vibrio vulnificus]